MIVVANRIPVAEGWEDDFEERLTSRLGLVDQTPGFVRNLILRPLGEGPGRAETYIVMTFWEDLESFEAWTRSDAFQQAHSRRPPKEMFRGPNRLEMHEIIADSDRRAKGD